MKTLYVILNQNLKEKTLPLMKSIINNLNTVCSPTFILYFDYNFAKQDIIKHISKFNNIITIIEKNDSSQVQRISHALQKAHELKVDKIIFIGCKTLFFKNPNKIIKNFDFSLSLLASGRKKILNSWVEYLTKKDKERTFKNFTEMNLYTGWYENENNSFFMGCPNGAMFNKSYIKFVQPYLNKIIEVSTKNIAKTHIYSELILTFLLFKMISEKESLEIEDVVKLFPESIKKRNMNWTVRNNESKEKKFNIGKYKITHGLMSYPDNIFSYFNLPRHWHTTLPVKIVKSIFEDNLFGKVFSENYFCISRFDRDINNKARLLHFDEIKKRYE